MSQDFWNHDKVVMLLQLYKSHRVLWDTSHKEYKNKFRRKDSFSSIATELGVNNVYEIKKKIGTLLVQYRREIKAIAPKPGMSSGEKKSRWWGLAYLQFLGNKGTPQETVSSMAQSSNLSADTNFSDNEMVKIESDISSSSSISSLKSSVSRYSTRGASGSVIKCFCADDRVKRAKRNQVDEAYNVMQCSFCDLQQERPRRDEYSVYGENIANRMRKLKNPIRVCRLQNAIDNIIFKAEMDEFEERNKNHNTTAISGDTRNLREYNRETSEESRPSDNPQTLE